MVADIGITKRQLADFASIVFESEDVVEVRAYGPTARSKWLTAKDLPRLTASLIEMNHRGHFHISAGINPRVAVGKRGDQSVKCCRCLVADHDGIEPEHALETIAAFGLPPATMTISSGHGSHSYWRLTEPVPPSNWRTFQLDLAAFVGADSNVANPERVMRLPGLMNIKSEPFTPCAIVGADPSRFYDLADLDIPQRPETDVPLPKFRVDYVDPARRNEQPAGDPIHRCRSYVAKMPAAVAGAGGHRATWEVANVCNRFGLTEAQAMEVMAEYNDRCDPPWSAKDLTHKVRDAYRRNGQQHGEALRREWQTNRQKVGSHR